MLKYCVLVLFSLFVFTNRSSSQQHYIVYFTDKNNTTFDPYSYFDKKAIERRVAHNINLFDVTDFPINQDYFETVNSLSDEVFFSSRWFNCIGIVSDNQRIDAVKLLHFVKDVQVVFESDAQLAEVQTDNYETNISDIDKRILAGQLDILGKYIWDSLKIDGKGVRIAIFDGGFRGSEKNPFFQHIYESNRVIYTKDFTSRKKGTNVYYGGTHGTAVWSCIAGKYDTIQTGLATGAEFLLAKTEKRTEFFKEELNWAEAAEWADKNGADIINSSLGYTYHRYFNFEMNGKKSFVAKAANMAAQKGILVVNAAGNEGNSKWHYVGTPADADSVLSVGGINPRTGYHINFSSYGPTSDNRLKPNVVAYGEVISAMPKSLKNVSGTSFASPLIAGFAACVKQKMPNLLNMQLFKEIEKSGNTYPYFDYAHGYGIPQASYFCGENINAKAEPTFDIVIDEEFIKVVIKDEFSDFLQSYSDADSIEFSEDNNEEMNTIPEDIEELENDTEDYNIDDFDFEAYMNVYYNTMFDSQTLLNFPYLYYNFMDKDLKIMNYNVVNVYEKGALEIDKSLLHDYHYLNIQYKGYTKRLKLN